MTNSITLSDTPDEQRAIARGLELDAVAFRENTVYDSEGDPMRLVMNAERMEAGSKAILALLDRLAALEAERLQSGVDKWMDTCFGEPIKSNQLERADRFCEEALELCQTMPGFTAARAHALVDYVFGRDTGEQFQEVGGVMVTLAALCNTVGIDMAEAGQTELARVWTKVDAIRAKQAAKPTGSALPVAALEAERAVIASTRPDSALVGELHKAAARGHSLQLNCAQVHELSAALRHPARPDSALVEKVGRLMLQAYLDGRNGVTAMDAPTKAEYEVQICAALASEEPTAAKGDE